MTQLLVVYVHVMVIRRESGLIVVLVFVLLIVIVMKATKLTHLVISTGMMLLWTVNLIVLTGILILLILRLMEKSFVHVNNTMKDMMVKITFVIDLVIILWMLSTLYHGSCKLMRTIFNVAVKDVIVKLDMLGMVTAW